ncbi:hypothetical protein L1887_27155 [Cichorium endivia]|nr:hypothetical protein L1887_27155 [Cichorium endivia]
MTNSLMREDGEVWIEVRSRRKEQLEIENEVITTLFTSNIPDGADRMEIRKHVKVLKGNKWDTHPRVAVVREAAKRKLVLNDASIAEMKVGEGKTLAAYLNDLTREGVHVYSIFNYAWNLVFDYLRDNLAGSSGNLLSDVDEVDSILIDQGRNPLLISGEASKHAARYPVAAKVADQWFAVDH